MAQVRMNLEMDVAVPGMLADENLENRIVSYPAGEAIEFGRLVEISSNGQIFKVRGTGASVAAGAVVGVSVFDVAREQQLASTGGSAGSGFYQSGDMVPVLRKGRIFGQWDGSGSQGNYVSVSVNHPSTSDPSDLRGVFSNGTVTTTAGSEITALGAAFVEVKDVSAANNQTNAWGDANQSVCLLDVNLPA